MIHKHLMWNGIDLYTSLTVIIHFIASNDHADRLAREAADAEELSAAIATPYLYNVTLITRIQHRLAAIMLCFPPREKTQRQPVVRIPRPKLDNLLSETGHEIVVTGTRYAWTNVTTAFA